jgi:hypothetical protein
MWIFGNRVFGIAQTTIGEPSRLTSIQGNDTCQDQEPAHPEPPTYFFSKNQYSEKERMVSIQQLASSYEKKYNMLYLFLEICKFF